VWRLVASPDKFPNDPSIEACRKIKENIEKGYIVPYLAETMFTIESIKRKNRKEFISKYKPQIICTERDQNGSIINTSKIVKEYSMHPGNHPILAEHLNDAISLGFKIVRCPRIAGIINPEIEKLRFKITGNDLNNYHTKLFEVCGKIESKGAGFDHIKIIGEEYDPIWIKGIDKAPDEEWPKISKAMAEWADGDSVAISIALECDYFCTRDKAINAGEKSVLSEVNLNWLNEEYNFKTVTPDELLIEIFEITIHNK